MTPTQRIVALALLGLVTTAPAARAQNLNDIGRALQDQVLGNRGGSNPDRERDAYERGRQDQAEQNRRARDDRQRAGDDRRRFEDDRRRFDEGDRRQRDFDRERADDQRARDQPRRY